MLGLDLPSVQQYNQFLQPCGDTSLLSLLFQHDAQSSPSSKGAVTEEQSTTAKHDIIDTGERAAAYADSAAEADSDHDDAVMASPDSPQTSISSDNTTQNSNNYFSKMFRLDFKLSSISFTTTPHLHFDLSQQAEKRYW